jgi:hypothetical protein
MKRWREGLLLLGGCAAVSWMFFQHFGSVFYNRYFEAATIFDPTFTTSCAFQGWSTCSGTGYQTFTSILYVSFVALLMIAAHAVIGTAALSHVYPAAIQIGAFLSMYFYLRKRIPDAGTFANLFAALFYTENPLAAGMIHEGYSATLIDYALLPVSLLLIERAYEARRSHLVLLVPLLYALTGMYRMPLVFFSWVAIGVLEFEKLYAMLKTSRLLQIGLIAAMAVNLYWAVPMLSYIHYNQSAPVQSDTANEINVTTQYASLSNMTLLKSFEQFGSDTGICSGCGYYESAWALAALVFLVAVAIVALIRARAYRLLILMACALVFSTGFRYQDVLLGLPYQIAMGLPTLGLFRDPGKALIIVVFGYSCGLSLFVSGVKSRKFAVSRAAIVAIAVIVAALPMLTGSILEYNKTSAAGSYFVTVPAEYAQLRSYLLEHVSQTGNTLLLPPDESVTYDWGARVNDFLPAYLGRPTLGLTYWPQPSPYVQRALEEIENQTNSPYTINAWLSALRVNAVVIHNDVLSHPPITARSFGAVSARFGPNYTIRTPQGANVAVLEGATGTAAVPDSRDAAVFAAYEDTVAASPNVLSPANYATSGCPKDILGTSAFTGFGEVHSSILPVRIWCASEVRVGASGSPALRGFFVAQRGRRMLRIPTEATIEGTATRFSAKSTFFGGWSLGFVRTSKRGQLLSLFVAPLTPKPRIIRNQLPVIWRFDHLFAVITPAPFDTVVLLNQSFSDSWQAYNMGGSWTPLPKFLANGYANGWRTMGAREVLVFSWAQAAFFVGLLFATLALLVTIFVFARLHAVNFNERIAWSQGTQPELDARA